MNPPPTDFFLWRVFGLEPNQLTPLERTLLRVALFVGLFVLAWTYWDNCTYAGVDLRNRVVGARVMLAGYDPYAFFWQPQMPEEWLDPVYDPKAHRLTISPPTLLLYAIIAPLPFKAERFVSFVLEWLALITSLGLLARSLGEPRQRAVFLLGATFFIIASDIWRMHLERGQVYVFILLLLSIAIHASRRGQVDSLAAGIALGVVGLMRPNLLLMAPALLLIRQFRAGAAMMTMVALGAVATFLILPASSWKSYANVGDQYYLSIQDPDSVPDLPRPKQDGWAEGVNFDKTLSEIESSTFAYGYALLQKRLDLPMLDLALTSKVMLVLLAVGALAFLACGAGQGGAPFALALMLSLDTEFLLPHRWAYADVILLAPFSLMLPSLLRMERAHLLALSVVMLGLVSGAMGQHFFGLYLATVLRSWLVMAGLTGLAIADVLGARASARLLPS